MSVISKPIMNFVGWYFEQLFNHPIKTKAVTSCVIASSASYVSQKMAKNVEPKTIASYGLFGLLFGGTMPHYFYAFVEKVLDQDLKFRKFLQFAMERLMFAPIFQGVSLYTLARFEGKDHDDAVKNLMKLYIPVLTANWKYLSFFTFINFTLVPPMLRVLFANIVGFCWIVFLARKRRQLSAKSTDKSA